MSYVISKYEEEPSKMCRYVHANIIAKNASKLINFYTAIINAKVLLRV